MQARRIARELALLSISQLPNDSEKLSTQQLQDVMLAAIRALTTEVHEALENAAAELNRGRDRLLESELRAADPQSSKAMLYEAVELTQTAINRLGTAVELPELIQLSNQSEVREYALQLVNMVIARRIEIDALLEQSLVDWQLHRLARIDRDILRISVAEMLFLGVPDRIAINEAVEIAKRYSGEDGHRFINGVLRRVTQKVNEKSAK
jgi:transcription antitermination protein NusB